MNNVNLDKAKYFATLVLHCTSMAELFLKDYEAELYKQGSQSRQAIKMHIKQNARQAEMLRLNLKSIEQKLFGKLTEEQEDCFFEDTGFLHNVLLTAIDRCGDSELRRTGMLKKMKSAYKSSLNIIE